MCGFAGFYQSQLSNKSELSSLLEEMSATIVHRGPDSHGIWLDDRFGIGFCHRRLSIQDLSPLGHQPMTSETGRYVIVFNGEIYI